MQNLPHLAMVIHIAELLHGCRQGVVARCGYQDIGTMCLLIDGLEGLCRSTGCHEDELAWLIQNLVCIDEHEFVVHV